MRKRSKKKKMKKKAQIHFQSLEKFSLHKMILHNDFILLRILPLHSQNENIMLFAKVKINTLIRLMRLV